MIAAPYVLDYLLPRYGGRCVRLPKPVPALPPDKELSSFPSEQPPPFVLALSPAARQLNVASAAINECICDEGFIIVCVFKKNQS